VTVVLFEDEQVQQLYPVTVGRAAFSISCGGYTLLELIEEEGWPRREYTRPHVRAYREAAGLAPAVDGPPALPVLLVNAALVPSTAAVARLRALRAAGQPLLVPAASSSAAGVRAEAVQGRAPAGRQGSRRRVAAALLPAGAGLPPAAARLSEFASWLASLPLETLSEPLPLLEYPHDIVRWHLAIFAENLAHRLKAARFAQQSDGVFVAPGAMLGPYVVADTRGGPVVLDERAQIGPYCYLRGPLYVGPDSRVIEHAAIKDGVALGHTTKIGGEIEGSIVESYTNKQHHGFLGHSYLGSWINLGAGTCTSDLKNTYGQVNMEYQGVRVATGMQFIGCIMGDYAKTAINTSIFTGKTVGVCSMLYGFVTTNVPSFVNYARSFGQVTEAPVDVMVATQARMFARRQVEQRPCDIQLLHDMYELTRHERQIAGEPLSL
jgi:glucose-1-phosphate thymidylyltransferase